ncbi:MAG: 2-enoyl thioester reductase domain-containing protein [Puniceicoccaceae bacterium]
MNESKALIYKEYGLPSTVIDVETRPVPDPGPGEVLLQVLAAPVHPSDFGMILGKYGQLKELPAIAGREGVAVVKAAGEGVTEFQPGDRVVVPKEMGSWQTCGIVPAEGLFRVPADIPVEMAAMVMVNPPTAWRLLRDSGLASGDWVIQNAANSAVGLHVIEMAHHLGLKTINVVRREELVEPLLKLGADHVVLEDSGYEKRIKELTGGQPVKLALNSVGGESAIHLVNALSPGGIHITFGAMQFEAVRFPTRALIFNDVHMKGFWMDKWFRSHSQPRIQIMYDKIFDLMRKGIVSPSVDSTYPIEDFKQAFERAGQPRLGKVLFTFEA